ncbi:uncharacterized protein [Chanodichthys erythropterus]|uniref:uncharacterized protein n=1 Tax=Chanodichthys erythropterus TaxID=933992 RepID=UPI00351EEB63
MEDELRELRDLVAQLKADNERLRQEPVSVAQPGPSNVAIPVAENPPLIGAGASTAERFVFIPRDRKCPKFSGRSGIGINEWVEEAQACMRLRHLSTADQAFFLFDHLEGEAREEIRYRSRNEREDPDQIIQVLRELYGCTKSYVALQESFFSRRQQDGETLVEFSLALMSLLEKVKSQSPHGMPNAEVLLRDQFVEYVNDCALRRELKQFVRRQPTATLFDIRSEALRWEREGMPGGVRGRSQSVPSAYGIQYGVQGHQHVNSSSGSVTSEMSELRDMLRKQQQQLNQLTQSMAQLQNSQSRSRPFKANLICRRCQQPGHFARDCDGERRSASPSARVNSAVMKGGQSSAQPSEN